MLEELPITQKQFAQATGIPEAHLSGLKKGNSRFTPEHDLRITRYLKQSEGFWLRLQLRADLRKAKAGKSFDRNKIKPIDDKLLTV
ncbi:HigA family addiction module antitoxin [Coraliomargarita parva]|uniref:HigA family addiction module antitoxin n=1 Tax=Coraliomargarita parva TaxID=3014050 RepID=UPI0022B50242|nr:HigA family addiction module antitoxin [Coraliomargarita parva]